MRSTAAWMSPSSSVHVSRYTSRSPPNGSLTSASSPSRPAYSPSTKTRPSPPSPSTRARRRPPLDSARAARRELEPFAAALRERALEQRRRQRAAADVAGAHQQDAFRVRLLGSIAYGASRPAARRSTASGSAPSRTSRGAGCVQSTTVDGGELPSTPPSSTSSVPASRDRKS